uniref:BACK domain-containing protein n=1 Tax=Glossina pallidipes TaxID=7398 RepID=A0A1B0A4J4_GLOPL
MLVMRSFSPFVYLSNSMAAKTVNEVEHIPPKKCKNSDYGNSYLDGLTKMRINQKIKELIKNVQHVVKLEDIAYKAAINWVKHDLERRRVHLAEFMSQIRLPLVSTEFLTEHIVAEPLLTEDQKCYKFVMEALTYQLKESNHQLTKVTQLREKCQTGIKHRNESFYVFLLGGTRDFEEAIKECKVYDISKKKVVSISNMNEDKFNNSAVCLNGVIYSVGGYNNRALKTAECYDPATKRWSYIAPMNNGRENFGICTYNDLIYVVGGWHISTVESYDRATNKWHLCQSITGTNAGFNRATVAENSIYSLTRVTHGNNALFRLDPRDGKWCKLNEMPGPYDYELVSYDRTLFAIRNENCKRLDIRMNKWEPMPHMLSNRYGFSAVIVAKDIYVFGDNIGFNTQVASVERFNIHNNEWTTFDSTQIEHNEGGAAVLSEDFDFNGIVEGKHCKEQMLPLLSSEHTSFVVLFYSDMAALCKVMSVKKSGSTKERREEKPISSCNDEWADMSKSTVSMRKLVCMSRRFVALTYTYFPLINI